MRRSSKKSVESVSASERIEMALSEAKQNLRSAQIEYRSELDANPELAVDDEFAEEHAKHMAGLQRDIKKYEQMLQIYGSAPMSVQNEGGSVARSTAVGGLKETVMRAAKQGMAQATAKQIAKQAMAALGDNCPVLIQALPEDVRDGVLCMMFYMATQACPGMPGATAAGEMSLLALEGFTAKAVAETGATVIPQLLPLFKSVAALKAAEGFAGMVTEEE